MLRILIFIGLKIWEIFKALLVFTKWVVFALLPVFLITLALISGKLEYSADIAPLTIFGTFAWWIAIVVFAEFEDRIKDWLKRNWLEAGILEDKIRGKRKWKK